MKRILLLSFLMLALGVQAQTAEQKDTVKVQTTAKRGDAISTLKQKAESGDAQAQFDLAMAYFQGKGVEYSEEEAVKWYRKAAEQGHADAQFNLGLCYYGGVALPKSRAMAIEWYKKAAAQGHKDAQGELDFLLRQNKKK